MTVNNADAYIIDLSTWGIIQGIPSKPYKTDNYKMANNNVSGINNALSWAYQNGYDYVVLPRGQYAICYPNPIITQPNMTIDFNFSTLKVIYDSDNRSPFDTSSNPTYQFGGDSVHVTTPNTNIVNLILFGDRIDRSWTNLTGEKAVEGTNGVRFSSGANRSTIRNSNISYYMGDAIGLYYSPYTPFPTFTVEFGSLNSSGIPITGITSKSVRSSAFQAIPLGISSFAMIGLGYAPQTNIPSKTYNVYFYDSTGKFIISNQNIRTRDTVQIPKGATQLKLSWEGDGTLNGGSQNITPFWALLIEGGVADSIIVEFNEIHRCHRGGLFLGTNNAVIRKNYFHDTGMDGATDIDGLPTFTSSTRYCIDTEDNVGHFCKITDNVFANSRMGILLRGDYNEVSGNEFRNQTAYGIELYKLDHINLNRNYFYYSSLSCYPYDGFNRDWYITNNLFYASTMSFSGSGTIAIINNNGFYSGSFVSNTVYALSFKSNVFNNSSFSFIEYSTVLDSCSFINGSSINITSAGRNLDNNIIRCNFNSSNIIMQNNPQVTVRDSVFNDGGFIYKSTTGTYIANNCIFNNPTQPIIRANGLPNSIGLTTNVLDLENCTVNLGAPSTIWKASTRYVVGDIVVPTTYNGNYYQCTTAGVSGTTQPTWPTTVGTTISSGGATFTTYPILKVPVIYGFNWGNLILNNSIININNYSNYTAALLDYYGDFTGMIQIQNSTITSFPSSASNNASKLTAIKIDSRSILTNFSLSNVGIEIQSDMMTNAPTVGTFKLGQTVGNSHPTAGGYIGWVCITAGTASNTPWVPNKSYTVNTQVNVNGNVYQVIKAGTSGSTPPSGTGTSINDGTVTWKYLNPLAIFKPFGPVSS